MTTDTGLIERAAEVYRELGDVLTDEERWTQTHFLKARNIISDLSDRVSVLADEVLRASMAMLRKNNGALLTELSRAPEGMTSTGLRDRAEELLERARNGNFYADYDKGIEGVRTIRELLDALLASPAPAGAEGWVLVPKEATREMAIAAHARDHDGTTSMYHKIWAAMIAAASPAPAQATLAPKTITLIESEEADSGRTFKCRTPPGTDCDYPRCQCAPATVNTTKEDFEAWWNREGQCLDPDSSDVPWSDKRKGLAEYAFIAGRAQATPPAGETKRLQAIIERERSKCADVFNAIKKAIAQHEWLRLGRGSYEYNDDRWKSEFGDCIDGVLDAAKPLQDMAADWSDSPVTPEDIAAARAATPPAEARELVEQARDSALEEAAKIADGWTEHTISGLTLGPEATMANVSTTISRLTAKMIAKGIRGLAALPAAPEVRG